MSKKVIFVLVKEIPDDKPAMGSQGYLTARALLKALADTNLDGMYANNIKVAKIAVDEECIQPTSVVVPVKPDNAQLLSIIDMLDDFIDLACTFRKRMPVHVSSSDRIILIKHK